MELRIAPRLIASLIPEEARRKILHESCEPSAHDSCLSGFIELTLSVASLASMYFHFLPAAINGYVGQASARPGGETAMVEWFGGVPVAYGMGLTALAGFVFRWQTIVVAYFALEGSVRALAGFASDQVVPSMPLHVAQWLVLRARRAMLRLKLPPLVADRVTSRNEVPRIESCRPKPDWHRSACISYQGALYELVEERAGGKQRPWVYLLRSAPPHKVVRGLRYYSPEDVLTS